MIVKGILKIILFYLSILVIGVSCQKSEDPLSNSQKEDYWEIISDINEGFNNIFFIDAKNGWAVGDTGKIKYTNDGGKTWLNQNSETNNTLISVYFINNYKGFAAGYNKTLIYTENGGSTWKGYEIKSGSATIYGSLHSDISDNIYLISNYGEILYSPDAGQTWNYKYKFSDWGYSYLFYPNNSTGFAMKFLGSELQKTTDGGINWITYQLPSPWTGDIFFLNDSYGWVSENWGPSSTIHDSVSFYFTSNGGENWTLLSKLSGISLDKIVFTSIDVGWVTQVTKIYYTNNGGKSWVCQFDNENIGYIREIYFLNNSCGWALTSQGKIIKYSSN